MYIKQKHLVKLMIKCFGEFLTKPDDQHFISEYFNIQCKCYNK